MRDFIIPGTGLAICLAIIGVLGWFWLFGISAEAHSPHPESGVFPNGVSGGQYTFACFGDPKGTCNVSHPDYGLVELKHAYPSCTYCYWFQFRFVDLNEVLEASEDEQTLFTIHDSHSLIFEDWLDDDNGDPI